MRRKKAEPLGIYYPYAQPDKDSALLSRIVAAVPKHYPEAMRADICQEIAVILLANPRAGLELAVRRATKHFRRHESAGTQSLNQPIRNSHSGDEVAIKDTITRFALPGRKRGQTRVRTRVKHVCRKCGVVFYLFLDGQNSRRRAYCSKACKMFQQWDGNRKLPNATILRDLYVVRGWSTYRIANHYNCSESGVRHAMNAARIVRRPKGQRPAFKQCKQHGCERTVDSGVKCRTAYCAFHYRRHRSEWNRNRLARLRSELLEKTA